MALEGTLERNGRHTSFYLSRSDCRVDGTLGRLHSPSNEIAPAEAFRDRVMLWTTNMVRSTYITAFQLFGFVISGLQASRFTLSSLHYLSRLLSRHVHESCHILWTSCQMIHSSRALCDFTRRTGRRNRCSISLLRLTCYPAISHAPRFAPLFMIPDNWRQG